MIYTIIAGIITTSFLWFMLKGEERYNLQQLGSCKPNSYVSAFVEQTWYEHVESLQNDRDAFCAFDNRMHEQKNEYSYMTCGNGIRVEIEPLVSVLRDPRFPCKDDSAKMLATKSWIHVMIPPRDPKGSNYLFDLGASRYRYGIGGSSLDWLVETFRSKSVDFDRIFAWEAKVLDQNVSDRSSAKRENVIQLLPTHTRTS